MTSQHYACGLPDGPVRDWYIKHIDSTFLAELVESAEQRGYEFDPESGLLIRQNFPDKIIKELGYTVLDIITARPVDVHLHLGIDEAIYISNGKGEARVWPTPKKGEKKRESDNSIRVPLKKGASFFVPEGINHTFRPDKGSHLEIHVTCTGILHDGFEVQETRFDQYQPWVDYFEK